MAETLEKRSEPWPLRPWILAVICAASGLAFHFLVDRKYGTPLAAWPQATATFVAVSTLSFVITVELRRLAWAILFALGWGLVTALVGWFTARYNQDPTIFEWPYLSGLFAVLLAAPLFQTARDEGAWRFPYGRLHNHAWTDAVIGAASLLFTGVVFLLAQLIAGLFGVIGIDAVRKLVNKDWFDWILAGFAFGASVGLLREREALLATLRRLVMIVYSVLAPVLAVALALFLASIPFTGLHKLWNSGVPATPLLLVSGAGAILLANAVIGDGRDERMDNKVLAWSALVLVVVILPLSLIAALSMAIRVDQYGWTPERIWGVIAVAVAVAYGLAGWWSVWRGRLDFDDVLRPLQVKMAIGLCGIALLLALPILDFGATSASSQMARLNEGKVEPEKFDWAAMALNFGPAGRHRLEEVRKSGPENLRTMAATALKAKDRWELTEEKIAAGPPPVELTVYPADATVPASLRDLLLKGGDKGGGFCSGGGACRVYPQPGGAFVVLMDSCANLPPEKRDDPKVRCSREPGVFEAKDGKWVNVYSNSPGIIAMNLDRDLDREHRDRELLRKESNAMDRGDVKIAPVTMRQIEVGGKPAGDPFR